MHTDNLCAPWPKFQERSHYQSPQVEHIKTTVVQQSPLPYHTSSWPSRFVYQSHPVSLEESLNVSASILDLFHIRVDSIVVSRSTIVVKEYLGQLIKFLIEKEHVSLPLLGNVHTQPIKICYTLWKKREIVYLFFQNEEFYRDPKDAML